MREPYDSGIGDNRSHVNEPRIGHEDIVKTYLRQTSVVEKGHIEKIFKKRKDLELVWSPNDHKWIPHFVIM